MGMQIVIANMLVDDEMLCLVVACQFTHVDKKCPLGVWTNPLPKSQKALSLYNFCEGICDSSVSWLDTLA